MVDLDRLLPPAPAAPIDETGAPRIGAFAGSMEAIDLSSLLGSGLGRAWRKTTRLKRWQYVMLASAEVIVAFAIVDIGYAGNAFCFVVDRQTRQLLVEKSFLGLPGRSVQVGERPGVGARADFNGGGAQMHFERVSSRYLGTVRIDPAVSLNFTLETAGAPEALSMVVPVTGGILNCTQKWAGLPLQGSLVVGGRRFDLNGGSGGLDYTHGLLARETLWRWGFGSGVTTEGEPLGFNLGEGFNASTPGENAFWHGEAPGCLPEVHFTFDRDQPLQPWHIQSADGSVDLTFHGAGMHREQRNLLVARSRFVQVAGAFSGKLRGRGGRVLQLDGLPGVVEDQYIRW
jgi:hypothetical protein